MRRKLCLAVAFTSMSAFAAELAPKVPLIEAIKAEDHARAVTLLTQKADVNAKESDGTTALHWAVHNDDADLVDRLIRAGANVKAKNEFGATAMSEAANNLNVSVMAKLLKAGADPDSPSVDGMTSLMIVSRSNNVAAAKLLLENKANPNAKEAQRNQTPLMWAAAQKQPGIIKELLAHGADPNAQTTIAEFVSQVSAEPRAGYRSYGGLTPLMYAAREGCVECAQALVQSGAKINMADPEGVTPLLLAITNMHFDTAKYLINAGANVDKWDWWGRNPVYQTVDVNTIPRGGRPDGPSLDDTTSMDILKLLLEKGANPNLQLKLLPPFRNVGADRGVDLMLSIGATPLLRAAKALDADAIKLLLAHGALPNLPNNRGITPTMAAAGMGSVDADTRGLFITPDTAQRSVAALQAMLAGGGEINGTDARGQTPLHAAAFWGWNDAVKFLVDKGADVNAKDNGGKTPVDSAMGRNGGNSRGGQRVDVHQDTAELLVKLGTTTPIVSAAPAPTPPAAAAPKPAGAKPAGPNPAGPKPAAAKPVN